MRDLIHSMCIVHIEYMVPIVFGAGQRSFGVPRGQIVNTLEIAGKHDISRRKNVKDLILFMKIGHIESNGENLVNMISKEE